MSDMAKQARAAMKAKASKLTSADPHQKVDSSTWTPPEALNTEAKTGLRPISRRAFKKGGKVMGEKAKMNLGKSIRGGNKPITPDNFANKDVKAANQDRPGVKHIGGLKTGGKAMRKGRDEGGKVDEIAEFLKKDNTPAVAGKGPLTKGQAGIKTGGGTEAERAANRAAFDKEQQEYQRSLPQNRKSGGRTEKCWGGKAKKAGGGAMAGAQKMLQDAQQTAGVPSATLGFTGVKKGSLSPARGVGLKKGGTAKHDDVKEDMALIKKMVKPSARTGRKEGGGVFTGTSYPGKIPGVVPGGREARATGGKTGKGKTNINIVIAAGKPANGQDMMGPPPGMDGGPQGLPIPVPPPGAGGLPMGGGAPMPMPPMPQGAPAGGPPPMPRKAGGRIKKADGGPFSADEKAKVNRLIESYMPVKKTATPADFEPKMRQEPEPQPEPQGNYRYPTDEEAKAYMDWSVRDMANKMNLGRKAGGRITKTASSYKDMEAGAAGGEGRLQKTDIAKKHKGAPAFKAGGKVYKSYKDMDAGSASGLGRLEKTEIQKRKG